MQIEKIDAIAYLRLPFRIKKNMRYYLENQLDTLGKYAEINGFKIGGSFLEIEKTANAFRNEFRRMVLFMKQNPEIKHIFVYEVALLWPEGSGYYAFNSINNNIEIHFVYDQMIFGQGPIVKIDNNLKIIRENYAG